MARQRNIMETIEDLSEIVTDIENNIDKYTIDNRETVYNKIGQIHSIIIWLKDISKTNKNELGLTEDEVYSNLNNYFNLS